MFGLTAKWRKVTAILAAFLLVVSLIPIAAFGTNSASPANTDNSGNSASTEISEVSETSVDKADASYVKSESADKDSATDSGTGSAVASEEGPKGDSGESDGAIGEGAIEAEGSGEGATNSGSADDTADSSNVGSSGSTGNVDSANNAGNSGSTSSAGSTGNAGNAGSDNADNTGSVGSTDGADGTSSSHGSLSDGVNANAGSSDGSSDSLGSSSNSSSNLDGDIEKSDVADAVEANNTVSPSAEEGSEYQTVEMVGLAKGFGFDNSYKVRWHVDYQKELLILERTIFIGSTVDIYVRTSDFGIWLPCSKSFSLTRYLDDPNWDGVVRVMGVGRYSYITYFNFNIDLDVRSQTEPVDCKDADETGYGLIHLREGQQWKSDSSDIWNDAPESLEVSVEPGKYMVRDGASNTRFASFPTSVEVAKYVKPDPPDEPDPIDPDPPVDPKPEVPEVPDDPAEVKTPEVARAYVAENIETIEESLAISSDMTTDVDFTSEESLKSFVSNWVSSAIESLGFDGVTHQVTRMVVVSPVNGTPENPNGTPGSFECDVKFTSENGGESEVARMRAVNCLAVPDVALFAIQSLSADVQPFAMLSSADPVKSADPDTITLTGEIAAKPYEAPAVPDDNDPTKPDPGNTGDDPINPDSQGGSQDGTQSNSGNDSNQANSSSNIGNHPLAVLNDDTDAVLTSSVKSNQLRPPTAVSSLRAINTANGGETMREVKVPYAIENIEPIAPSDGSTSPTGPIQRITTTVYSYSTGNPGLIAAIGPYGVGALIIVVIVGIAVVGFMLYQKRSYPKD